jgi:hypothetical protein
VEKVENSKIKTSIFQEFSISVLKIHRVFHRLNTYDGGKLIFVKNTLFPFFAPLSVISELLFAFLRHFSFCWHFSRILFAKNTNVSLFNGAFCP